MLVRRTELLSDAFRHAYGADSVRYSLAAVISVSGLISAASFLSGAKSIASDIATFGEVRLRREARAGGKL
jgi:hypothetical protein